MLFKIIYLLLIMIGVRHYADLSLVADIGEYVVSKSSTAIKAFSKPNQQWLLPMLIDYEVMVRIRPP